MIDTNSSDWTGYGEMRDCNPSCCVPALPSYFSNLLSRKVAWSGVEEGFCLKSGLLPPRVGEGGPKCRGESRGWSVPRLVPRFVEGDVGPCTVFGECDLRPGLIRVGNREDAN